MLSGFETIFPQLKSIIPYFILATLAALIITLMYQQKVERLEYKLRYRKQQSDSLKEEKQALKEHVLHLEHQLALYKAEANHKDKELLVQSCVRGETL